MGRVLILAAALSPLVSCDVGRIRADGRPVGEAWGLPSTELNIEASPSPLRAEREIPLLSAPEVFAVYVPSRLDRTRDLLIGEHWMYLRLRDGEWFIERDREPAWTAAESAAPGDILPLRNLEGMDKALIPWKEPKGP